MGNKTEAKFRKCDTGNGVKLMDSAGDHIQHMKPSSELIIYYQKKVEDLSESIKDLEEQLELCKNVAETNWHAQDELVKRNEEISKLTSSVSDLQVYLYKEREYVLQLSADNDKLRLMQLEFQKKLDIVLSFAGLPKDFITFVCADPRPNNMVPRNGVQPNIVKRDKLKSGKKHLLNGDNLAGSHEVVERARIRLLMRMPHDLLIRSAGLQLRPPYVPTTAGYGRKQEHHSVTQRRRIDSLVHSGIVKLNTNSQVEIEKLHIQALMAEWEEQSRLYHDEIHSLLSDRDLRQKEWSNEQDRLQQQILNLNNMLKSVQSNVCDDSDRLIKMEKRHRTRENAWMEEKANLLKSLESAHEAVHTVPHSSKVLRSQLSALKKQLMEKDKIISTYKDENLSLEDEIEKYKNKVELDKIHNEDKSVKVTTQLRYFKRKCDEEKRRRLFESEGFRNDVKFLRNKIETLEKRVQSVVSSE